MYNKSIKQSFIEENKHKNVRMEYLLNQLFEKTEKFEELYDKDACNWNASEIMSFYKMQTSSSLEYIMVLNNRLKNYTSYCMMNNAVLDAQNHYAEITNEVLNECVNRQLTEKKILTREEVLSSLNKLANECDKFVLLGIFEGIYGKSARDLYFVDINDINGNIITLKSGKSFEISDELIQIAKRSTETYEYYSYNNKDMSFNFDPYDHKVIKQTTNSLYDDSLVEDQHIYHRIFNKVKNIKSELCLNNMTIGSIKESGRISMIKKYMEADGTDAFTAISNHKQEISVRYGTIVSISRYLIKYKEEFGE